MQRLRHPIRSIKEPFGKAGLTVAICALVMALVGGAYAAGGLTKSQEKQVTKIAKKFAGKPGATGPAGAAGTNGTNGKDGTNGAPGESVTIGSAGGSECEGRGGSKFSNGTGTGTACNGKNGTTGFTSTLPPNKTEMGEWALTGNAYGENQLKFEEGKEHLSEEVILNETGGQFRHFGTAVSFNIPLAAAPAVHYIRTTGKEPFWNAAEEKEEEREQPACPGKAEEPEAQSGSLCVYAAAEENTEKSYAGTESTFPVICSFATAPKFQGSGSQDLGCLLGTQAADKTGFGVYTVSKERNPVFVVGTWAVTG